MLSSVFKRRKIQKRLTELTSVRQAVSPPSPDSFVSPEIVDIYDKGLAYNFGSESSRDNFESSRSSSPHVRLDLGFSGSISEWFPTNLLAMHSRSASKESVSLPSLTGVANGSKELPGIPLSSPAILDISSENISYHDAQADEVIDFHIDQYRSPY